MFRDGKRNLGVAGEHSPATPMSPAIADAESGSRFAIRPTYRSPDHPVVIWPRCATKGERLLTIERADAEPDREVLVIFWERHLRHCHIPPTYEPARYN